MGRVCTDTYDLLLFCLGQAQARPRSSLRAEEPAVSIGRMEASMHRIVVIVLSMHHHYIFHPLL